METADAIALTQKMAEKGLIEIRPSRGGVLLYLPGEAPAVRAKAVDKIGVTDADKETIGANLDDLLASFQK